MIFTFLLCEGPNTGLYTKELPCVPVAGGASEHFYAGSGTVVTYTPSEMVAKQLAVTYPAMGASKGIGSATNTAPTIERRQQEPFKHFSLLSIASMTIKKTFGFFQCSVPSS